MKRVVIYTKDGCPSCALAKTKLRDAAVPFTELRLHRDFTEVQVKELYPEARTFPIVVVDDFHIGGFTELEARINEELRDPRRLLLEDEK